MKTIEFESAQFVKIEYELAKTTQRIGASLIDIIVFFIYFFVMSMALNITTFQSEVGTSLFIKLLLIKLPWIFYNPFIEYVTRGQSLGKYIVGIRVVTINGERPGLKEVFTRWLFRGDFFWISADFFVLFWVGLGLMGIIFSSTSEKKQRLGDVMANTIVVVNTPSTVYGIKDILAIKNSDNHQTTYPSVVRFTDEDMLLIKNTIRRVNQHPNEETKKFTINLAKECAHLIGLEEVPQKKIAFLQTLLQDYVVLTR